ncbi:MAG TPA: anthranilate synthase component I [Chitinispirillaceae bacterium]|nr:anthranilate synthase component I [Chitinispirillaceae bacterium]
MEPSLEEFKHFAAQYTAIPVYKTILADTETPVSVWMKLFNGKQYSFLLESVSGVESIARYSILGAEPFCTFSAKGEVWSFSGTVSSSGTGDPIGALRKELKKYSSPTMAGQPQFYGGAIGFFSYDTIRLWENIPDKNPKKDSLNDIFFGFYKNLVVFDNRNNHIILISNVLVDPDTNLENAYNEACKAIGVMEGAINEPVKFKPISVSTKGKPVSNTSREAYQSAVEKCKEYIKAGDIFQVVLSQRFSIEVEAEPFDLYRTLRFVNPSPYMYFLSIGDTSIVGASPEMLVRLTDGILENRPIAGTIRRGNDDEEDERLIQELINDPKERAEHVMLVDLGRNDIGRVSEYGSVRVENMMHIEKYSHVMHIVSNVKGTLRSDKDMFDALYSCFPAGTLSGAPKIRAMEIIDELEPVKRGLYGGTLGYFDFKGNMNTCIVIRTIIYNNGIAYIQAGAGIVADSVPSKEYDETVQKSGALFSAIEKASQIGKK